jgi:AraC-like DNA-binding protein
MRPRIRTAALTGYADLARPLGLDPTALMSGLGLDIADLDVPDRWIPAAPVARLLEASARQSGCEDFGLRMAERRRLGSLGPLGVVLRDAPDLRAVVGLLRANAPTYDEALHLRLTQEDGLATIEGWLAFGEPVPTAQSLDLTMAALVRAIRGLVDDDWQPLSVHFSRPAPADRRPYHRLFGPSLRFGADSTGLVLHTRELDAPVLTSDPSLRPYTERFLREVAAAPATSASAQVAEVVEDLLPSGTCSVQQVCRRLGLRPRELPRLLAEDGTGFSDVVHATRRRLVERYLGGERYSLTDISQLLGFAAPSAFSRWFHQQFGTSPTQWRATVRDPSAPAVGSSVRDDAAPPPP